MFQEEIGKEYIVTQAGTSEGTQIKYKKDNFWYKKDSRGKEGLAEYLSSKLLEFSGSHERMFQYFGTGFRLDYEAIWNWLEQEPDSREKSILEFQLRRYENILRN